MVAQRFCQLHLFFNQFVKTCLTYPVHAVVMVIEASLVLSISLFFRVYYFVRLFKKVSHNSLLRVLFTLQCLEG